VARADVVDGEVRKVGGQWRSGGDANTTPQWRLEDGGVAIEGYRGRARRNAWARDDSAGEKTPRGTRDDAHLLKSARNADMVRPSTRVSRVSRCGGTGASSTAKTSCELKESMKRSHAAFLSDKSAHLLSTSTDKIDQK